jgi:hypothetical protein
LVSRSHAGLHFEDASTTALCGKTNELQVFFRMSSGPEYSTCMAAWGAGDTTGDGQHMGEIECQCINFATALHSDLKPPIFTCC